MRLTDPELTVCVEGGVSYQQIAPVAVWVLLGRQDLGQRLVQLVRRPLCGQLHAGAGRETAFTGGLSPPQGFKPRFHLFTFTLTCKNGWRIFITFGGEIWDVIDLI